MSRLMISAAHKSSGKTTLSIGLCAALTKRGHVVQPFKKGPDYIDPMWLALASGRPCYNLDFHTLSPREIQTLLGDMMVGADLALIEGNKGLFDGVDLDGSNSNAAMAKLLSAPVVLVVDCQGMTRGIAPLLLGYQAFDTDVQLAGVILNKVGGRRHESKLRETVEHYTDIPVLGAVHFEAEMEISERHLGLVTDGETDGATATTELCARRVAEQVDLNAVLDLSRRAGPLAGVTMLKSARRTAPRVRIGIARDAAFCFYYPDDLAAFEQAGAQLIPFDTMRDVGLPNVDGLFFGGGFPETHAPQLERNFSLRHEIKTAIENGMPCYAECGGLMYLSRSIEWQGKRHEMVGAVRGDSVMHAKPQGRGYVQLRETGNALWAPPGPLTINAHEFHYSGLDNLAEGYRYAYNVVRGYGITGQDDGLVYKNLLASYTHLRSSEQYPWAQRFVNFVAQYKLHSVPFAATVNGGL